ncbi:MAG: calcium-binding protein [Actinobacteria bacterium]|nr:calcium-binding protein [Actinomycetota bacterium]
MLAIGAVPVLFVGTSLGDSDPNATITAGPANGTTVYITQTPSFTFSGNADTASFECRVDGAAFAACTSPFTTGALANGAHSFDVRALDGAGVPEATPDSRGFTIDYSSVALVEGGVIKYLAKPGQNNVVTMSTAQNAYTFTDTGATFVVGPGCTLASGKATCSTTGASSIYVATGDGNDTVNASYVYPYNFNFPQVLEGGAGTDTLSPGPTGAAHTISGGDGIDTASYANRSAGVSVSIDGVSNDGGLNELGNVSTDVENLIGSNYSDSLTGSSAANVLTSSVSTSYLGDVLDGGLGADSLVGSNGNDVASYASRTNPVQLTNEGTANDGEVGEADNIATSVETLKGGSANDTLSGWNNADYFDGGPGNDTMTGGSGGDYADYSRRTSPVVVSLDGIANDGDPLLNEQDVFVNIQRVHGGAGNDTITGSSTVDYVFGNGGIDDIRGLGGPDQLHGGDGNDYLDGGTHNDTFWGDAGVDTVDYSARQLPLTVTTADNSANDGEAGEGDNVRSDVETVKGGLANDSISGSAAADTLEGGPGRDVLSGLDGNDTFLVRDGLPDSVTCGLGSDSLTSDTWDTPSGDCESIDAMHVVDTHIVSGPSEGSSVYLHPQASSYVQATSFSFDSGAASFECSIDSAPFTVCSSPYSLPVLDTGAHEFRVRAVDSQIGADETPATRHFSVERRSIAYVESGAFKYFTNVGESNNVTLGYGSVPTGLLSPPTTTGYTVTDTGTQPVAGPGCFIMSLTQVGCPLAGISTAVVDMSDGNDTLQVGNSFAALLSANGGDGEDTIINFSSGAGTYSLNGGAGNDMIRSRNSRSDMVSGGDGIDTVDYSYLYFNPVVVTLDGIANDGYAAYEADNVMPDVENVTGTGYDDTLTGSDAVNTLTGGNGNDTINGGAGADTLNGDAGIDTILARDGVQDTVSCGTSSDSVTADFSDSLGTPGQCETVSLPPTATIDSGPANGSVVTTSTVEFGFSTTGPAQMECSVDSEAFHECVSPLTLTGMSAGAHEFRVRARDEYGNVDPLPASRTFTVNVTENLGSVVEDDPQATAQFDIPIDDFHSAQVELASGNLTVGSRDRVADSTHDFVGYDRYYRSQPADNLGSGLGAHWSLSVGPNVFVRTLEDESVELHGPGGYEARFVPRGDGGYDGPGSFTDELSDEPGGGYRLYRGSGDAFVFGVDGKLAEYIGFDGGAHQITLQPEAGSAPSRLARIGSDLDPAYVVNAGSNGLVTAIEDFAVSAQDQFSYQGGMLTAFDGQSFDATYAYDLDGYLESLEIEGGPDVSVSSDPQGRALAVTVSGSPDVDGTYEFSYGADSTTITHPDSSTQTFTFAANGESVEDPLIQRQLVADMVEHDGLTQAEAVEQLKKDDRLDGFEEFMTDQIDDLVESFGQAENGRAKLLVTSSSDVATAQQVVDSFGVSDLVDIEVAPMSRADFDAAFDDFADDLNQLLEDGQIDIYGDETTMSLTTYTANDLTQVEREMIDSAKAATALSVSEQPVDAEDLSMEPAERPFKGCRTFNGEVFDLGDFRLLGCKPPLRGAMALEIHGTDATALCSSGFAARDVSTEVQFLFTAGHCVHNRNSASSFNTPNWNDISREEVGITGHDWEMGSAHGTKGIDAGYVKPQSGGFWGSQLKPWVAAIGGDVDYQPRYAIKKRAVTRRGRKVCVIGMRTGVHCGKVVSTRSPTRKVAGVNYRNLGVADICGVEPGDSGSPVVRGHAAIGIVSSRRPGFFGLRCSVTFSRIVTSLKQSKAHLGASVENSLGLKTLTSQSDAARSALSRLPSVTSSPALIDADGDHDDYPDHENEPTFTLTPNGLSTDVFFEFANEETGEIVLRTGSTTVGAGNSAISLGGADIGCILYSGLTVRLVATNRSGAVKSEWENSNTNCSEF